MKIKLRPTFGQIGWNWAAVAARARASPESPTGPEIAVPFDATIAGISLAILEKGAPLTSRPFAFSRSAVPINNSAESYDELSPPRISATLRFFLLRGFESSSRHRSGEKWQLRVIIGQITARITSFPYADGIRDHGKLSRPRYIFARLLGIISFL